MLLSTHIGPAGGNVVRNTRVGPVVFDSEQVAHTGPAGMGFGVRGACMGPVVIDSD